MLVEKTSCGDAAAECCKKFGGFCGVWGLFGQGEMIIVLSWMWVCC